MKRGFGTRRILVSLLIALGCAGATLTASAQEYDLVILNGRVMDPETMLDAKLNVGVRDGMIAIITKEAITGKETINVVQWYAAKKDQWPLNYGTVISQEGVRMLVHDPEGKIQGPQDATTRRGPPWPSHGGPRPLPRQGHGAGGTARVR